MSAVLALSCRHAHRLHPWTTHVSRSASPLLRLCRAYFLVPLSLSAPRWLLSSPTFHLQVLRNLETYLQDEWADKMKGQVGQASLPVVCSHLLVCNSARSVVCYAWVYTVRVFISCSPGCLIHWQSSSYNLIMATCMVLGRRQFFPMGAHFQSTHTVSPPSLLRSPTRTRGRR